MGSRRVNVPAEESRFLEEAGRWRSRCVEVLSRAPIGGDLYKATSAILDAIDGLAEAVTGDRGRFHLKPPTTPGKSIIHPPD